MLGRNCGQVNEDSTPTSRRKPQILSIPTFPSPRQSGGPKGCLRRLHFMRPFAPCFGKLVAGAQVYLWATPSSAFIVVRHLLLAGKRRRARSPSWLAPRKRRPSRNRNCVHAKDNRVSLRFRSTLAKQFESITYLQLETGGRVASPLLVIAPL